MNSSVFKRTAISAAVAGTFAVVATAPAEANVLNVSWTGVFTMLNSAGGGVANAPSDWAAGYYGIAGSAHGTTTAFGWYGNRTPITGTFSFDTSTGAGVGTVTPFTFFGDGTEHVANAVGMTFQAADTIGTIIGTMLFSWNGGAHPVSIVLDGSGMFGQLGTASAPGPALIDFMTNGPSTTIAGVGALPATEGLDFDAGKTVKTFPLGPSPLATKTTNTNLACAGVPITSQTAPYSIVTLPAFNSCFPTSSDTIGGSPISSGSFEGFNPNFDVTSVHLDSFVPSPVVPVPAAVWLFGSGLAGLAAIGRRRKSK